ncbi:BREX-1 system adenine-specific DNA-methyltransferase PglX [Qipengyuania gaetbuli]|uniref:BREX-1 system adenine-specific DNA-methyltransferase PglX n=1 Tax=Qipengyuania gaetbuli TaxID=266952 RepID=UPI001CFE8CC5|nr:BREX-1 system adenine-specific DNA-methyltransferase PglX [Qipengyuania gaetbuli]
MDTSILKKFAPQARKLLIDQVSVKLRSVLASDSAARREQPKAVTELEKQLAALGEEELIEKVAYTWFNRLSALRFMDANGLNTIRAVTPAEGQSQPEILAEAMAEHIDPAIVPKDVADRVRALLSGAATSSDPQAEAYQLLLVAVCNAWHSTMPFMFERIADYTELLMPTGLLAPDSIMVRLREVMNDEACQDVEIIGWLYQFYISEKKDEVFAGLKKNKKITAENIPAATQLFTPHWIVRYLVENSLGRLWMLNHPNSRLVERMDYYIAPEEPETDFLRTSSPEEIRICDPACGSGHMLTYAFDLLYAIYEEQGYEPSEIPAKIITHNLTGIEIDDRAGALAAFALAMKTAARLGRRRFMRMEAKPDIVVMQDVAFTPAEMQDVAAVVGEDLFTDELQETLGQFTDAKNFGSLIVPKLRDPAEALRVVEARDFADDLLLRELQKRVLAVLLMSEALRSTYHVVVANPPYMGAQNFDAVLKTFASENFTESRADLFSMFMERGLNLLKAKCYASFVTMQTWMFISSFEDLRYKVTTDYQIRGLIQIGFNSFPEMNSKVAQAAAFIIQRSAERVKGAFFDLNDAPQSANKRVVLEEKIEARDWFAVEPSGFSKMPENPIAYWATEKEIKAFENGYALNTEANPRVGLSTSDTARFVRPWHELNFATIGLGFSNKEDASASSKKWFPLNKGGEFRRWYGNNDFVLNYMNDGAELKHWLINNPNDPTTTSWARYIRSPEFYFRESATWSKISSSKFSVRYSPEGFIFSDASNGIFPEPGRLNFYLGLLNSSVSHSLLKILSPTLNFKSGDIGRIPVLSVPKFSDNVVLNLVKLAKFDWDESETSWDFERHPLLSEENGSRSLEMTYSDLRADWGSRTNEVKMLEEENNRIFIDAYGLQDELNPDVPLAEITLNCNPTSRYSPKLNREEHERRLLSDTMAEFLSYSVGCMFGRYSLEERGLILANHGETLQDYLARVPSPSFMPDEDNVIPILDRDWFADDITGRFRTFLRTTFGEDHFTENLRFIESALGKDIRKYFLRDFYNDHVKRYKKHPIYWLFSSPKGSFNALIYMHRYRPDTISVVLNDYLREYIRKLEAHREQQERIQADPSSAASAKTKAAREIEEASKVLAELEAYEKDVLYPLATQRVGIDLDDGVKANYPKFGAALKRIPGLSE